MLSPLRPARPRPRPDRRAGESARSPRWVQLGRRGAEFRALVDATPARAWTSTALSSRCGHGRAPTPPFRSVCRLAVPPGASHARLDGRALPLPRAAPQRILIFGDTGCRVKGLTVQDCNDPRLWPFALIARKAAAWRPDLVIHVGDYYYRESPCPPDTPNAPAAPSATPGRPGGRSSSIRPSPCWPPRPSSSCAATTRAARAAAPAGSGSWTPRPNRSAARPRARRSASISATSTSTSSIAPRPSTAPRRRRWPRFSAQLDALGPDLARRPGWIVTHRPIWGLTPVARLGAIGPLELALNATEQAAVRGHDLSAVQMVRLRPHPPFRRLAFGPEPAGATDRRHRRGHRRRRRQPGSCAARRRLSTAWRRGSSFDRFGYLLLERAGADWTGTFRDINDKVVASAACTAATSPAGRRADRACPPGEETGSLVGEGSRSSAWAESRAVSWGCADRRGSPRGSAGAVRRG